MFEQNPQIFPRDKFTMKRFIYAYNVLDSRAFCIVSPELKKLKGEVCVCHVTLPPPPGP